MCPSPAQATIFSKDIIRQLLIYKKKKSKITRMFIIGRFLLTIYIVTYLEHVFKTSSYVARHQTHCCSLQGIYFKFTNFIYSSDVRVHFIAQMYVSSLSRLFLAGHFVMGSSYSAVGFRYPERSSYS